MKKTKMHKVIYGRVLPSLPSYPRSVRDHDLYTLFGSLQKDPTIQHDCVLPSKKELRKRIRETGKQLYFDKLHIQVLGVTDSIVISQKT